MKKYFLSTALVLGLGLTHVNAQVEQAASPETASQKKQNGIGRMIETYKKIENGVLFGYKKIEDGVVSGYKKIEDGVVSGYKAVENKFVNLF